jgi:hypothetical protein
MHISDDCTCEPKPPTDAWVSLNLADVPADLVADSTLTLTNLQTGVQQAIDLVRPRDCLPIAAGQYRAAFHTPGHEPWRDLVAVEPGEPVSIRPTPAKVLTPNLTMQDVLTKLRAPKIDISVRDLDVPTKTTIVLGDHLKGPYEADWQMTRLDNVDTAKEVLGIADADWGVSAPRYGSLHEQTEFTPTTVAAQAAKEYIFGNSATASQWKSIVNSEIFKEAWEFRIFQYGVVTIHAGGVLRITDKSSFFTCEKLRMHTTAKLEVRGKGPGVIWPLSYESFCGTGYIAVSAPHTVIG